MRIIGEELFWEILNRIIGEKIRIMWTGLSATAHYRLVVTDHNAGLWPTDQSMWPALNRDLWGTVCYFSLSCNQPAIQTKGATYIRSSSHSRVKPPHVLLPRL